MKQVSMKRSKAERENSASTVMEGESPDYPWGLRITLNDEQLDALGLGRLPVVGGKVKIEATAAVQSVSDEAVDDGKRNRRVELQITDLAVEVPRGQHDYDSIYGKEG